MIALLLALSLATLAEEPKSAVAAAWPHLASDVPSEPRIHFGVFGNGVRYAWMDNPEPKKRAYVRLHVNAGSLSEEEPERGLAHFLEHMCFNGTKHHPGSSLVEWFQKNGMDFGADTNASTGYSQTIYMLDLPTSDETTLREGLTVLRDFSDGILLDPAEVEAEKGVVDAEERERDSPIDRAVKESFRLQFAGTRIPERDPIGVRATRAKFTPEATGAFHAKWYRPEDLTLVLVGDLAGNDPTELIEKAFADVKQPEAPLAREPSSGTPSYAHPFYSVLEQDLPSVSIEVQMTRPWTERPSGRARAERELPLTVAHAMLNLRFSELRKQPATPFLSASVTDPHDGLAFGGIRVQDADVLSIECTPDKWHAALAAGEQELRRAIEHGFQPSELDEVRAGMLRQLDEAVEREKTRDSASWVQDLLETAEVATTPANAATTRDIVKPVLAALDVAACKKALESAWGEGRLVIGMAGPLDLGSEAPERIRAAYEESRSVAVTPRSTAELEPWAYSSDPAKVGPVVSRDHVEDLDVYEVRFENGVRAILKKTDFAERQILVSAIFGRGRWELDPSKPALAWVAERVFDACALEAHSADDLRKLFAGKKVGAAFDVQDDAFELNGATTREDLALQCELFCARLMHAGWREEGMRVFLRQMAVMYEALEHQHDGPLALQFLPEVYSGDKGKGLPARAEVEAVKLDDVKKWLDPLAKHAWLDVVVVGDIDLDEAILAVARTFGTLPQRIPAAVVPPRKAKLLTGLSRRYAVDTQDEKSLLWIMFPTADGRDVDAKRSLAFLANVVSDRLRVEVREKLSATYSPGAMAYSSDAIENDGFLGIQAMADPAHVEPLTDAVLSVASALAENGPSAEEVDRLREPAANQLRDARRSNMYWRSRLARLHARKDVYDELRTDPTWIAAVKAEALTPYAKSFLAKERADVAVVEPKAKPEPAPAPSDAPVPKHD